MSTINANSSGIVFTGNTDGTLDLATGGTTRVTVTSGGNFNFAGTGQRITGDFSNATIANRPMFQSSVTNGSSNIQALPNGTGTVAGLLAFGSSDPANSGFAAFQILNAGDTRITSGITGTGTYVPITFYTGGSEKVRIDTSGNVGIGTASPGFLFDASNASAAVDYVAGRFISNAAGSGESRTWLKVEKGTTYGGAVGGYISQGVGAGLLLGTQNATSTPVERMRIDHLGNVGIGTASPTDSSGFGRCIDMQSTTGAALYLRDSDATSTYGYFAYEGGGTRACYFGAIGADTIIRFITAGSERGRVTAAGEWLIGGTTDNGAYNLQCNGTGVWGAGAYVNGSDVRLKDNITTLNDGLNVINQLRPVTFKYKPGYSKDQSTQPGFIAQELQAILAGKDYVDGVVQAGPKHLNVAYQTLIPILVKSIQELAAKVAALEGK
jgi:hypothetical protein